jgi:uncharacterized cupredoxin-like copper-binding protein
MEVGSMRSKKLLAAALLIALAACVIAAVPALGSRSATTTVTVRASEFKFVLSKKRAPKGTVFFKVINKGTIAHDFKINGKKTRLLQRGKSTTLKVVFSKAGKFRYLCTVPGHAAAGMKGTFTVG